MTGRELSPADWLLLGRAFGLTVAVRVALRIVPFRHLRRLLQPRRPPPDRRTTALPVARIAWAVAASARRVPDATCLTQALVAERLLRRAGHPARLHLGVARPKTGQGLRAHAWVESDGAVVVGGGELDRFAPLPVPQTWHR